MHITLSHYVIKLYEEEFVSDKVKKNVIYFEFESDIGELLNNLEINKNHLGGAYMTA